MTTIKVPSDSDPSVEYDVTLRDDGGSPVACSCPDYTKRARAYPGRTRPCKHMRRVTIEKTPTPAVDTLSRVYVGGAAYYAATYETVLRGVRYVGSVSETGTVRLSSVEHAERGADYPLDVLSDADFAEAMAALTEQARLLAARGEVDIFSLPASRSARETAQIAVIHAAAPGDRRARRELEVLKQQETDRRIAIAARLAGKAVAA